MSNPDVVSPSSGGATEIAGQEIVLSFGDVRSEYAALRSGAIVIDRSHRGRIRFFGEKAGESLTGLVTNDVLGIAEGHGQYGAALSAKGRIIADVRIFASPDAYLVDTPPRAWPGLLSMIRKYVNPRVSGYRDESHALRDLGIFGVEARRIVAAITGVHADSLATLAAYAQTPATVGGAAITIVRSPDIGLEGYELLVPFDQYARLWDAAVDAGATPAGLGAWEIARVEAGRPEWGIDIDDSTIPQEANFDDFDAISYTKGCYIGQEVVARVHFRGHVNRHLRGLRSPNAEGPPTGAQLIDDSGNHVGDVRSAVSSPRLGGIAMAMVRREIAAGATLNAKWEGGEQRVDVTLLPFSA
ncbi:MAG TPA: glycine cleavage T C-terminal barrel domain-containing protein [Gemmatimonadaceae bacterium]|jgi:folate-binding protein YgfZ|nr:glycine cleavage T C-terminal barrel domain-containing protein [Gemmatimonadaceae bacterium]